MWKRNIRGSYNKPKSQTARTEGFCVQWRSAVSPLKIPQRSEGTNTKPSALVFSPDSLQTQSLSCSLTSSPHSLSLSLYLSAVLLFSPLSLSGMVQYTRPPGCHTSALLSLSSSFYFFCPLFFFITALSPYPAFIFSSLSSSRLPPFIYLFIINFSLFFLRLARNVTIHMFSVLFRFDIFYVYWFYKCCD